MDDRWLSVDEIVAYLGVSRDTVYNWIATRGMPAHRVGRLWKFKKEAIDAWVESGGAETNEPEPGRDDVPGDDGERDRRETAKMRGATRGRKSK